jgi:hypothetical protein
MFEVLVLIVGGCLGAAVAFVIVWWVLGTSEREFHRHQARERRLDMFYETNQPKGAKK